MLLLLLLQQVSLHWDFGNYTSPFGQFAILYTRGSSLILGPVVGCLVGVPSLLACQEKELNLH